MNPVGYRAVRNEDDHTTIEVHKHCSQFTYNPTPMALQSNSKRLMEVQKLGELQIWEVSTEGEIPLGGSHGMHPTSTE